MYDSDCISIYANTSSAFARSVLMARPKGIVVEVNDEDAESVPRPNDSGLRQNAYITGLPSM